MSSVYTHLTLDINVMGKNLGFGLLVSDGAVPAPLNYRTAFSYAVLARLQEGPEQLFRSLGWFGV